MITIPNGQYIGKILECGILQTKAGKQMAFMKFGFSVGVTQTEITWYGSLATEKSKAYVKKTFQQFAPGLDKFADIAECFGKQIKEHTEAKITIMNQPNPKKDNQLEPKVKYVNASGKFKKTSAADAAAFLDGDCPF